MRQGWAGGTVNDRPDDPNLTPDGKWRWNGTVWEPNLPAEAEPDKGADQVDGTATVQHQEADGDGSADADTSPELPNTATASETSPSLTGNDEHAPSANAGIESGQTPKSSAAPPLESLPSSSSRPSVTSWLIGAGVLVILALVVGAVVMVSRSDSPSEVGELWVPDPQAVAQRIASSVNNTSTDGAPVDVECPNEGGYLTMTAGDIVCVMNRDGEESDVPITLVSGNSTGGPKDLKWDVADPDAVGISDGMNGRIQMSASGTITSSTVGTGNAPATVAPTVEPSAAPVPKPRTQTAYRTCKKLKSIYKGMQYVETADDGATILIDTKDESNPTEAVGCILSMLETPKSVISAVESTTALAGVQEDEADGISYRWSYHPDNGMNMIIVDEEWS